MNEFIAGLFTGLGLASIITYVVILIEERKK